MPRQFNEFNISLFPHIIQNPRPVILDIGSNDGANSLMFKNIFPDAIIHCFEPDPRAISAFRLLHAKSSDVYLHEVAIGKNDCTVEFYVSDGIPPDPATQSLRPSGWDLSGSIKKPKNTLSVNPWCTFNSTIQVQSVNLDTWAKCYLQSVAVDLIWMDVQGAEGDILKSSQLAQKHTKYIFTEYSDDELYEGQSSLRELISILKDFSVLKLYENDILMKNCSFAGPFQDNLIFC